MAGRFNFAFLEKITCCRKQEFRTPKISSHFKMSGEFSKGALRVARPFELCSNPFLDWATISSGMVRREGVEPPTPRFVV